MQKLLNTTMTKVPLMKELKNLGVNGTGQRKYNSPVIAKLPTENVTIFTQTQDKGNTPKAVGTMDVDDVFSFPDNKTLQMHNITTQKFVRKLPVKILNTVYIVSQKGNVNG